MTAILSVATTPVYSSSRAQAFLKSPGRAFVEVQFAIPSDFPQDALVCLDMEMMSGLTNPLFGVRGGDWMGFIGLMRGGSETYNHTFLLISEGTTADLAGTPTGNGLSGIRYFNEVISPNTWYTMRIDIDFGKREFVKFKITGADINQTVDLSGMKLDYPNYMPFDRSALFGYVGTMRNENWQTDFGTPDGNPIAYFDNFRMGQVSAGKDIVLLGSGFETQTQISTQSDPFTISKYVEGRWYEENANAELNFVQIANTGTNRQVLAADAEVPITMSGASRAASANTFSNASSSDTFSESISPSNEIDGVSADRDLHHLVFSNLKSIVEELKSASGSAPIGKEDDHYSAEVSMLYVAYFNRAADHDGLEYWRNELASGAMTFEDVARSFSVQEEAKTSPLLMTPAEDGRAAFLDEVYLRLFNRSADDEGLSYWSKSLAEGTPTAQLVLSIALGAIGNDTATLANKTLVSRNFAEHMGENDLSFNVKLAELARDFVVSTTDDESTIVALVGVSNIANDDIL